MAQPVAIVTGASLGIGRAIAERLLRDGYRVVGLGRQANSLEEAGRSFGSAGASFCYHVADVRDSAPLEKAFASAGPIDILIANAGIVRQARLEDPDASEVWREVLATNLDGVFNTARAGLRHMSPGGRIVIVSSGLGKLGRAAFGAYSASKHGVLGLMKCLALELAPRRITVNAVCPGWVATDMSRSDLARFARERGSPVCEIEAKVKQSIPLGRFVEPGEVANLVAWLTSKEAAAITGQAFNISGGEFTN